MWEKYNLDELRDGGRNLGVAIIAAGFIGLLFERELLAASGALALGALLFLKSSEKEEAS